MSALEFALRAAAAVFLVSALAFVSWRASGALLRREPVSVRWCGWITGAAFGAAACFHALIALHVFRLPAVLALAAVATAATIALGRRGGWPGPSLASDLRFLRRVIRRIRKSPFRVRIAIFLCFALLLGLRTLVTLPISHDSLVYHITKAAFWVQTSRLDAMWGPGQWQTYSLYLAGAEIFPAWAMLPFHGDLLAGFVDWLAWVGTGLGLIVLSRELGAREPHGSVAAAVVLSLPAFKLLIGSGYVEPLLCMAFVNGCVFAFRCIRRPRAADAFLALAGLGLAASSKLPLLAPAGVLGAMIGLRVLMARRDRSRVWLGLALGMAAFAVVVGPWLWQSYARTGHPLSPMPVKIAGLALGVSRELEWFLSHTPFPKPYVWANEKPLLLRTFALPTVQAEALGVFALVPLALAPLGWAAVLRRRPLLGCALLLATAACVGTYLSPSLAQMRFVWPESSSRFLLPTLCLAAPAAVAWMGRSPAARVLSAILFWTAILNAAFFAFPFFSARVGVGMARMAAAILVIAIALRLAWPRLGALGRAAPAKLGAASVGLIALLCVLDGYRNENRFALAGDDTVLAPVPKYWLDAARAVDDAKTPRTVALTSGPDGACIWFTYWFFGRHLQNRVTYVSPLPDGSLPEFCPSTGWQSRADFDVWLGRLRAQGVTDVMSFPPASAELAWLEQHPKTFERASGVPGQWGLFRLR